MSLLPDKLMIIKLLNCSKNGSLRLSCSITESCNCITTSCKRQLAVRIWNWSCASWLISSQTLCDYSAHMFADATFKILSGTLLSSIRGGIFLKFIRFRCILRIALHSEICCIKCSLFLMARYSSQE